jgi:heme oxygenase
LRPAPLPERLRLETRDLHAAAERSGVMGDLLHGRLGLASYRAMLRNLHTIYDALEAALDARQADPQVAPLRMPELYRTAALASDLDALDAGGDETAVEDAAAAYAGRLAQMARAGSPALVAHAYVRYLGDLHGGQALKRVVARTYGLGAEGTSFYEFGDDAEVLVHRAAFRAALAALPVSAADADLIVAEARWAFAQHQQLFEQLQARHAG